MGKYKFRLSDMVPNGWFYKLRDMGHNNRRRRNQNYSTREKGLVYGNTSKLARKSFTSPSSPPKLSLVPNRASYYYSTAVVEARKNLNSPVHIAKRVLDVDFPFDTPRKSKRRSHRRHLKVVINSQSPKLVSPSVSVGCGCSGSRDEHAIDVTRSYETDIFDSEKAIGFTDSVTDTDRKSSVSKRLEDTKNLSKMIELAPLTPIRTRSHRVFKDNDHSFYVENKKSQLKTKTASQTVHRIRTRVVSPRVAMKNATKEKKLNSRDLKKGLAVMKYSSDPERDFTESMIEMIIANNMRSSSDLEDLLACYLSLNSAVYHSAIVKVFKQIWLDLNKLRIIE